MDMKLFLPIREDHNWHNNHLLFQYIQDFLTVIVPVEREILFQQLFHWRGDLGIALDELPIVSGMPYSCTQLFHIPQHVQVDYHYDFCGL